MKIYPLSAPYLKFEESIFVKECVKSEWVSSSGKFITKFEEEISKYTKSKFVISCVNGTSALHIALKIIGVDSSCEVIVPSLTFIAPVNAVRYCNADPIFMDSDQTHNLDIKKTIKFLEEETIKKNNICYNIKTNKKIKALIPVHVWGNAIELDLLIAACKKRNIKIVEDSSESLGTFFNSGKFKSKHTGTIGDLGCISFNGNKIVTCGGGGAILTSSKKYAIEAKYLINQAKENNIFYEHNKVGYNYRLQNINAAIGYAQIKNINYLVKKKRKIFNNYKSIFKKNINFTLFDPPNQFRSNKWLNVLKIKKKMSKKNFNKFLIKLNANGVEVRPIWKLNHTQKEYSKYQSYEIQNAKEILNKNFLIPSSIHLKLSDQIKISQKINKLVVNYL